MKTLILISCLATLSLQAITTTVPSAPLDSSVNSVSLGTQNDKELAWVDEQIKAILPARIGVADGYINSLNDPIKYKKAKVTHTKVNGKLLPPPKLGALPELPKVVIEPLRLYAVMNKSALINNKWYRINDPVRDYSLAEVRSNSVLLTGKKGQQLILFISKQNNNIKIITK